MAEREKHCAPFLKKSQSSLEFLLIITFMVMVFVSFFALANSKLGESQEQQVYGTATQLADLVVNQVELASGLNDGYSTTFTLPQNLEGASYAVSIIDERELVVVFNGYEHVEFLPMNITGNPLQFGLNVLWKRNGELELNT
jgi:hypothetical protein